MKVSMKMSVGRTEREEIVDPSDWGVDWESLDEGEKEEFAFRWATNNIEVSYEEVSYGSKS